MVVFSRRFSRLGIIACVIAVCVVQYAHAGSWYDKSIREKYNMPTAWFECEVNSDCGLAHVPCNTSVAVNTNFRVSVERNICGSADCHRGEACLKSTPDASTARCENKECVTGILDTIPVQ